MRSGPGVNVIWITNRSLLGFNFLDFSDIEYIATNCLVVFRNKLYSHWMYSCFASGYKVDHLQANYL